MSGVVVNGPGGETGVVDGKVWVQLDPKVRELPIACPIAAVGKPKSMKTSVYRCPCCATLRGVSVGYRMVYRERERFITKLGESRKRQ